MVGEFELIRHYLAPLAAGVPGAEALRNDAAVITPPPGRDLVLTADALTCGVHFREDDPADLVARKALRVNLSDLAAMGAEPLGYLMTVAWPDMPEEAWIARFAAGLAADQAAYGFPLLGGDTTATPGPMTLSITALGSVAEGRSLRRSSARAGDDIYVSGTVGDAALGLKVLSGTLDGLADGSAAFLSKRYRLPEPRLALGQALAERGLASAAIDLSDGLAADLTHVLEESSLGATVGAPLIPLSDAAREALAREPGLLASILGGGDDYELLFTVRPAASETVDALGRELGLPLTRIGNVTKARGLSIRDDSEREIELDEAGWRHF